MKNAEKVARLIYYELIPIIIGFYLFSSFGRVTDLTDFTKKIITFIIYMIPISIVYVRLGDIIFSRLFPEDTIAHRIMLKMVSCNVRKERGSGYCASCPDGYKCAASVGNNIDNILKTDKINNGDVVK